ncbi:MAG: hypothetical protein JW841_14520 [Deltaproteobacteria bacterium]|nr:hypothetical protein [Deltaproteobacteria bacterium]
MKVSMTNPNLGINTTFEITNEQLQSQAQFQKKLDAVFTGQNYVASVDAIEKIRQHLLANRSKKVVQVRAPEFFDSLKPLKVLNALAPPESEDVMQPAPQASDDVEEAIVVFDDQPSILADYASFNQLVNEMLDMPIAADPHNIRGTFASLTENDLLKCQHIIVNTEGSGMQYGEPAQDILKVTAYENARTVLLKMQLADGTEHTKIFIPSEAGDLKTGLFGRMLDCGSEIPGNRFEYDKSRIYNVPPLADDRWDIEMTKPDTVEAYEKKVYPAISSGVRLLRDLNILKNGDTILDVGSGRGDLALRLNDTFAQNEYKIIGAEPNRPSRLEANNKKKAFDDVQENFYPYKNISFKNFSGEQLANKVDELNINPKVLIFSGVLASAVLTKQVAEGAAQQAFNILPPGGAMIVASKTDPLLSAADFRAIGFEILNTYSPEYNRPLYVLRKPVQAPMQVPAPPPEQPSEDGPIESSV